MRKNSARKWLHATLDLLPVLLISVFMIYSHRHSLTERTEVDIKYKYETNEVNSTDDLLINNIYHSTSMSFSSGTADYEFTMIVLQCESISDFTISTLDDYDISNYISDEDNYIKLYCDSNSYYVYFTNENAYISYELSYVDFNNFDFVIISNIENFKYWVDDYYSISFLSSSTYNVIESVDVLDTNSNIMSVFMDNFNSTVSTYFNLGNVFNMNDVYNWFNTNIFGGNAPAVMYSVYNIIVYEFIMDMLFLLYGVFMFLIDFVESLMDRVFSKTRNGGR